MRIALDATYSLDERLSGIGVYSRELMYGLAASQSGCSWEWFLRSRHYWRALFRSTRYALKPGNVKFRLLTDSLGSRSADIFHGLNQRLPSLRFRRQVVTFHDLFVLSGEYSTPDFRIRFAAQAREAAARADLIVTVSAFTAHQVEEYLKVPAARIRVIHHGVLPRQTPDLPREKVVLCVGAIQRRKNQAGLVRAFRAMPSDWSLILAGSFGFGSEGTLQEIAASPAGSRIHVTGYLSDVDISRLYARAGIFAFPSLDEGFGMPVLEAMAGGVPVITSNRSALPEVAGDAAMLIDPENEIEIAHALQTLSASEEQRSKLAARGKIRAAGFTWERAVEQTATVYKELL